jgi:hypothetical protein
MGEETESAGQKEQPAFKVRDRRTEAFAAEVYAAVRSGKLAQPFSAVTVKRACPGWSEGTYRHFFNKHRVGNPTGLSELFVRRASNRFEITNSNGETVSPATDLTVARRFEHDCHVSTSSSRTHQPRLKAGKRKVRSPRANQGVEVELLAIPSTSR